MILPLRLLLLLIILGVKLFGEKIETFYGTIDVEEPVLLELIQSPPFQRLASIHQYGVSYYTTHPEEYNRFDHSLGVFAILRLKGASLEEQIAGLLHDISHTVFSHVGDWVFGKEYQENDYSTIIQRLYLAVSGVEKILNRYGYSIDQILPKRSEFLMLEQPLPDLCADRIDYNIQGAYFQNFLTRNEAQELVQDLRFEEGRWILSRRDLATKLASFSIFMTEECWGSPTNYVTSRWLADAILRGLKIGLISWNEFHFGIDQVVWDKLHLSSDPLIQSNLEKLTNPKDYYRLVTPAEKAPRIKFKCRGIDPWIIHEQQIVRLTSLDSTLADSFRKLKEKATEGWPIEILSDKAA